MSSTVKPPGWRSEPLSRSCITCPVPPVADALKRHKRETHAVFEASSELVRSVVGKRGQELWEKPAVGGVYHTASKPQPNQ
jgi:hypothetical protein